MSNPWMNLFRETPPERLIDFSSAQELERWCAIDDVVMGGVSASGLKPTSHGTAIFAGEVSLERGGGFASVRSSAAPRALADARALVLRVRGDGKRYQLRLRTTSAHDGLSYLAPFETQPGRWMEVTLEAGDFHASWRGRRVPDAPPLALREVQSFGLLIADRQAGRFALELVWIARA